MTIESPRRTPLSPRAVLSWLASFAVAAGDIQRCEAYITTLTSALCSTPVYGDD